MVVYIVTSLFEYSILQLLSWAIIFLSLNLNIYQGYQCHGPWHAYPCQQAIAGAISLKILYRGERKEERERRVGSYAIA
jgi:hypothetical protein